jgi:hypothetical protein
MKPRSYKTNRWLWLAFSLALFLLYFYGLEYVTALLSGRLRVDDLLCYEFFCPLIISVVVGWLLQCAVVIVVSRKQGKADAKH